MNRRSATNGADYYLPGYFVADAFAAYKMKLQYPVTLQLNVKNLFDKSYYTFLSIATNNLGNQPGDPREVQFTVKMDLRLMFRALPRVCGLFLPVASRLFSRERHRCAYCL